MYKYITGIIIIIFLICLIGLGGTVEHNYMRNNCEVISVRNDIVTIVDSTGHIWECKGTGYRVGQRVNLHMHTNYTDTITDDIIIEVKG